MFCFNRSKPCKRKRAAMDEVDAEILRQLGTMKEPEADEDSLFAQSIAASLKRMGPQKKSLAKIKIQQALFEVEFARCPAVSSTAISSTSISSTIISSTTISSTRYFSLV